MPPKYFKKSYNKKKQVETFDMNTNAKYLLIVESPSKCKKIEEILGSQYKCIATMGHIYHLPNLKSINRKNNYEITYEKLSDKHDHIENMKRIISMFSPENIIIATDDDREGTGIAFNICQEFNLSVENTKRIIFHEITKNAIVHAVNNPTIIDMNTVYAQQARQILDIIVGFKISPLLWKHLYFNKDNSLSAGRCQTPALRLVYDNELEKKANCDVNTDYKILASFFSQNIIFELNKNLDYENLVVEFFKCSQKHIHKLKIKEAKKTYSSQPIPFSTSKLLQTANNVLGMSPKQTMQYCQTLYQNGFITYMRTENTKYSDSFLKEIENFIENKWDGSYLGNIESLKNKDNNNPHEAIRVTHLEIENIKDIENMDEKEKSKSMNSACASLYKLIWKNTIQSCMSQAIYNTTEVNISTPYEDYFYKHLINVPIHLGWKKLTDDLRTDEQNSPSALIMFLQSIEKSNKEIHYNYIESNIVFHNKHKYYTESTLIQKLEELKIGRPSTYSFIVDTIQSRGYVKKMDLEGEKYECKEFKMFSNSEINVSIKEKIFGKEKNKLIIQHIGISTIEFLISNFTELFSYDYTSKMEEELDKIVNDSKEWYKLCDKCFSDITSSIKPVSKQKYPLGKDHEVIFGKFGPIIKLREPTVSTNSTLSFLEDREDEEMDTEEGVIGFPSNKMFLPINKEIKLDLEKLKRGEYTLDDLVWKPNKIIETENEMRRTPNNLVLRTLNNDFSIRRGKFGPYIFYKTQKMSKPQFFNIKKFKEGFSTCDVNVLLEWIYTEYKLPRT